MVTTAISGDVTFWSVISKYFSDTLDKIVNLVLQKLKLFHEMREAKAKRRTAEIDQEIAEAKRGTILFEAKLEDMERRLRKHYNDTAAKFPGQYVVPIIQPSDDDDIEVFNEAMRRTKNEMQPKPTLRRRG